MTIESIHCAACGKSEPCGLPGQIMRLQERGWKQAVGHSDVWVCPGCVKTLFDKPQAAAIAPGEG